MCVWCCLAGKQRRPFEVASGRSTEASAAVAERKQQYLCVCTLVYGIIIANDITIELVELSPPEANQAVSQASKNLQ